MKPIVTLMLIFLSFTVHAQVCDYTTKTYPIISELDVVYGVATGFNGSPDTLRMNIFKPMGDLNPHRPLLIFIHGGAWLVGNRSDLNFNCQWFAARGYVTATIDYRLGFYTDTVHLSYPYTYDSNEAVRAIYRGMQDTRGAIRFLKDRALQDSTDTTTTVLWGGSAGAFIAMAAAFMNKPSEKPVCCAAIDSTVFGARPDLGPVEGTLNINGYHTRIIAVANNFGGMSDTNLIESAADPAIFSYHQVNDSVAPCHRNQLFWGMGSGFSANYPYFLGSCIISSRLAHLGYSPVRAREFLYAGTGTQYGHGFHDILLVDSLTAIFYNEQICTNALSLAPHAGEPFFTVFPNPVKDVITFFKTGELTDYKIEITDMTGALRARFINQAQLPVADLAPGVYFIKLTSADTIRVQKIVKE